MMENIMKGTIYSSLAYCVVHVVAFELHRIYIILEIGVCHVPFICKTV